MLSSQIYVYDKFVIYKSVISMEVLSKNKLTKHQQV